MPIACTACDTALTHHRDNCQWWTCANTECDRIRYDLGRGAVLLRSGVVEVLGTDG
jgi:hypothetical protein